MPTLTITEGPHRGTELQFEDTVVLGRGGAADLSLPDPGLSRRHARLTWENHRCHIEDLGSANGTRVNGRLIRSPTLLSPGDAIEVGFLRAVYSQPDDGPRPKAARTADARQQRTTEVVASLPIDEERDGESTSGAVESTSVSLQARFASGAGRIGEMVFDRQALVDFVAAELLALLPRADRVFVMLSTEGAGTLEPVAVRGREDQVGATPSRTLLEDVIANREARLIVDTTSDTRYAGAESMHGVGIRTAIGVPVVFREAVYGAIQIDGTSAGLALKPDDLVMAASLAAQLGMALGYADLHTQVVQRELLEHDLALATRLQQHFMPERPPEVAGYVFEFETQAALAVGGDFYDFLSLDDGRIGIVVGDVSGKGVSAALYAAKLASDLRYQAVGETDPARILEQANRITAQRAQDGMFATVVLVVLTPDTGRIEVSNAGHPLPLLRDTRGRVRPVGAMGNLPLGVDHAATFTEQQDTLRPGETIVFYTDGVTEALNERDQMFGETRLLKAIAGHEGGPGTMVRSLRRDLRRFTGSAPQSDDITILCLRRDDA